MLYFFRDKYLLNADDLTPTKSQHFRFLGILIGIAIRTSKPIAINLAPIVWKLLGCAKLSVEDLEDVDYLYAKSLLNLKDIDVNGIVTEAQFKELIPSETFMGTSFRYALCSRTLQNVKLRPKMSFCKLRLQYS